MKLGFLSLRSSALLALLLFGLSSCFNFSQGFKLHSNGSAQIEVRYSIDKQQYQLLLDLEQAASELEESTKLQRHSRYFDVAKLKTHLKKFKSVQVRNLTVYENQGRLHTTAILYSKNLQQSLRDGLFPYMFLQKKGELATFTCTLPYGDGKNIAIREDLRSAFKFELKFASPGDITTSNGTIAKNKRSANWNYKGEASAPSSFSVTFKGLK